MIIRLMKNYDGSTFNEMAFKKVRDPGVSHKSHICLTYLYIYCYIGSNKREKSINLFITYRPEIIYWTGPTWCFLIEIICSAYYGSDVLCLIRVCVRLSGLLC